jgi:hypothetical protein
VPGVGEKTAVKFLQQYGSLDEPLRAHRRRSAGQDAPESLDRRARRWRTTAPGHDQHRPRPDAYDAGACRFTRDYDQDAVIGFSHQLEFRSLIKELP